MSDASPTRGKRRRVTQACDRCRTKKYRCDGRGPPCSACSGAAAECSYGHAGKPRGLRTGYVKVLEMLWGRVLQEIPGSEEVAIRLLATLSRERLDDSDQPALQRWRSSRLPSSIMALLDGSVTGHGHTASNCIDNAPQDGTLDDPPFPAAWNLDLPSVSEDASRRESTRNDLSHNHTAHQSVTQAEEPYEDPPPQQSVSTDEDPQPNLSRHQEQSTQQARPQSQSTHQAEHVSIQEGVPVIDYAIAPPQLPPEWHLLVQAFLSYEESWLPVLRKSSMWKMAYAYEACCGRQPEDKFNTQGDAATLWAALSLGSLHLDGGMSAATQATQSVAHALLTPPHSFEPDVTYAPAFLLWSIIHSSRHEFAVAKMKLAQAFALTTLPPSSCSDLSANILLSNACFVLDILIALATRSRPMNLVEEPSLTTLGEGELPEWEPFIDPLAQQKTDANSIASSKPRPSRTNSVYHQFIKLCSLLKTGFREDVPRGTAEANFAHWAKSLPGHLQFDGHGSDLSQDSRLPSETNFHLCSLIACSMLAASERDTMIHSTFMAYDGQTRTKTLNALLSPQQPSDFRRLPSSISIVANFISTITSEQSGAERRGAIPPLIRILNANLCHQYAWRQSVHDSGCATTTTLDNDSAGASLLTQSRHAEVTTAPVFLMRQIERTSDNNAVSQPCQLESSESSSAYQARSIQSSRNDVENTSLFCRGLTPLPAAGLSGTVSFDPADSALPDTYMDLFDPNESSNQEFMRALGFVDVGEESVLPNQT